MCRCLIIQAHSGAAETPEMAMASLRELHPKMRKLYRIIPAYGNVMIKLGDIIKTKGVSYENRA